MNTPLFDEIDCLRKKETVKGIIGKTQGVNNANKPPIKPRIKTLKYE